MSEGQSTFSSASAPAQGIHTLLPFLIFFRRVYRRVWWEIITEDVFQSNCFGRPGGMTPAYFDTNFPEEVDSFAPGPTDDPQVGYSITKFKMGKLANECVVLLRIFPDINECLTHATFALAELPRRSFPPPLLRTPTSRDCRKRCAFFTSSDLCLSFL